MKYKSKIATISSMLTVILLKLYVGIYTDDEFEEKRVFIKYRPIWKTFFYSPRGMSDWKISEMPVKKQKEQKIFDEFVRNKLGHKK